MSKHTDKLNALKRRQREAEHARHAVETERLASQADAAWVAHIERLTAARDRLTAGSPDEVLRKREALTVRIDSAERDRARCVKAMREHRRLNLELQHAREDGNQMRVAEIEAEIRSLPRVLTAPEPTPNICAPMRA